MRGTKSTYCNRKKTQSGNITVRLLHYLETQNRHAAQDSHRCQYRTDSAQPFRAGRNASHRFRACTDSSMHFRAGQSNGHKLRARTGPSQPFRTCPNDEPTGGQDFYVNRSECLHESQKQLAQPLMQAKNYYIGPSTAAAAPIDSAPLHGCKNTTCCLCNPFPRRAS